LSPKGEYTVQVAKERIHNCKTKFLLYGGGEDRPITPHNTGKKSVPHALGVGVPYATYDKTPVASADPATQSRKPVVTVKDQSHVAPGVESPKSYTAKPKKTNQGASKIGSTDWDSDVYRQNIAANYENNKSQRARAWGSGNILAYETAKRNMTPEQKAAIAAGVPEEEVLGIAKPPGF